MKSVFLSCCPAVLLSCCPLVAQAAGQVTSQILDFDACIPHGFVAEAFAGGKAPEGGRFTANPARKNVAPDGNCYTAADFAAAKRQTFTAQAYVRAERTRAFAHVMTQRRDGGVGASWSLSISPSGALTSRFDLQIGGAKEAGFNTIVDGRVQVADGRWHHVALVVDGAERTATLYCDYRRAASRPLTGPLIYGDGPFRVGQGLEGELRGVKVSDAALGADDLDCAPWFVRDMEDKKAAPAPVAYDGTYTRVQTGVRPKGMERLGTLIPKKVNEMSTSRWSVGCECLERNLASWDAYKDYLPLLGIKKIRLQGGWFRTETKKGVYDFAWLDRIVDEAHKRGLAVCLETSYRNPLYVRPAPTGPGDRGFDDWGEEEYAAWDRWVEAMVRHYAPKGVKEWMMYNEPNLGMGNFTPEQTAARWKGILENNIRTAEIVKRVDPEAKVAAFVLAGLRYGPITNMLTQAKARGKLALFDYAVFHGYSKNPDGIVPAELELAAWLRENAPNVRAWQGEAGCASEEVQYAMSGVPWTEYSQAKWNGRRMLCDLSCDVDSLLFTISDLSYSKSFISRYGLLKTNPDNSVIHAKTSFYSAQNIVSIFNDSLDRAPDKAPAFSDLLDAKKTVGFAAFTDKTTGQDVLALWDNSSAPGENRALETCTVSIPGGRMDDPVWVDLINGQVWALPAGAVAASGGALVVKGVPYYDGPSALVPRALLSLEPPKVYKRRSAPNMKDGRKAKAK